jgi:hypothetical protein
MVTVGNFMFGWNNPSLIPTLSRWKIEIIPHGFTVVGGQP